METYNETVDQACESICELVIAIHDKEHNEKQEIKNAWHIVQQVKDRFLAAHKREMDERDKYRNRKVFRLTQALAKCRREKDAEVSDLRELVGEMADELSKFHAWEEARAIVAKAREVIGGAE